MAAPRRSGAPLAEGGAPVPQRRRRRSAARCSGTCSASTARCSPGRRGGAHRRSCTGSASTRGPWTTACSTATASCSATRYSHRDPRTRDVPELVARTVQRAGAVRRHRPAAAAVQHGLPARRRPRHRGAGVGPHDAAAARPARLLADRRGRRRAHQRLHDRAARRPHRRVGERARRALGSCPGRSCRRCVDAGTVVGPLLPEVAADLGLAPDVPVVAVGSHDTASAVVGVPVGDGHRLRLHLVAAPGRSSASSSTSRCSPRRPARPTSPTRAASTARPLPHAT